MTALDGPVVRDGDRRDRRRDDLGQLATGDGVADARTSESVRLGECPQHDGTVIDTIECRHAGVLRVGLVDDELSRDLGDVHQLTGRIVWSTHEDQVRRGGIVDDGRAGHDGRVLVHRVGEGGDRGDRATLREDPGKEHDELVAPRPQRDLVHANAV